MSSIVQGYEYDVFISYRQNDNRSGWVTEFVDNLKEELASTIKDPVSVYFDTNPHDGLLETHHVDRSLEGKLKCLIFLPVISRTYCDPKCFAWNNEFLAFCKLARADDVGLYVRLTSGNVTSRILPVQIHDLDGKDQALFERESGRPLRAVNFIFKSHGVNRPLTPKDARADNLRRTYYRDEINKTANAIDEIVTSLSSSAELVQDRGTSESPAMGIPQFVGIQRIWQELLRRNVFRAAFSYLIVALLLHQVLIFLVPFFQIEERVVEMSAWLLLMGFPVSCLLAWFFEVSPHGLIRTSSQMSAANPYPSYRKKPLTSRPLVTVLLFALVIQYVYFNYVRGPVVNAAVDSFGNKVITIAVLPFENRSADPKDKYIADGITDDIINRLAIISGLNVTDHRNIRQFQGKLMHYSEIAEDLDVLALLVGSVQRSRDDIIIRAQLIDGKTSSFIWGNTYQRTSENIMAVQSEIAKVIADRLQVELNDLEKARLNLPPTQNPTAYDYYLRGRSYYYQYDQSANDSAVFFFKQAIELDSGYALAWAGLGDAYSQMSSRFGLPRSWLDSSLHAGQKAIELDTNLSEAYKAYANAYSYKKYYDQALPLLQKAVELNPTNERAVGNLGTNYYLRNDLPNALMWEKRAVGMNPKNGIPYQLIGWIYRLLGDLDQAESWLLKSLELRPDLWDTYEQLAYTYLTQGRRKDAMDLVPKVLALGEEKARPLEVAALISHFAGDVHNAETYFQRSIDANPSYADDPNTLSPIGLGQILLSKGDKVEAEVYLSHALDIFRAEIDRGSQFADLRFYIASIYAIKGNREQSLEWLDNAIEAGWLDYAHIKYGPYFSAFRTDSAFRQRVETLRRKAEAMRGRASEN